MSSVKNPQVLDVVQAPALERALNTVDADLGQLDVTAVFVGVEMDARGERRHECSHASRRGGLAANAAGDDQRRSRFVNQQRVGLVNQRTVERTVNEIRHVTREQIAQVIEARFLGGHVSHVAEIRATPLVGSHPLLDDADREAKPAVDRTHPLRVSSSEVIVEGQHVNALAGERVQRCRHHGRKRLPFAGLHLDDGAAAECDGRHDLDVERPEPELAVRDFADQREERHFQAFELRACQGLLAKPLRSSTELCVREPRHFLPEGVDVRKRPVEAAQIEFDRHSAKLRETLAPPELVAYQEILTTRVLQSLLTSPG